MTGTPANERGGAVALSLGGRAQRLAQNMPTFLQALFALTTDSSAKVRMHVIQGINFLLDMLSRVARLPVIRSI